MEKIAITFAVGIVSTIMILFTGLIGASIVGFFYEHPKSLAFLIVPVSIYVIGYITIEIYTVLEQKGHIK